MSSKRTFSLDILRILSAFFVVMIHVSTEYIGMYEVTSSEFVVANLWDCISRFSVPMFVMISGALFLTREGAIDTKRIWLHNILRIIILFFVWGFAYYAFQSICIWKYDFLHQGFVRTLNGIAFGSFHLWFLGMIAGIYVIAPLVKEWLDKAEKKSIEYFLLIFFLFCILTNTLRTFLQSSMVNQYLDTFNLFCVAGYLGYFVLGYYLKTYSIPKKVGIVLASLIPVDICINLCVSMWISRKEGAYDCGIYDSFGLFTFLICVALFWLFSQIPEDKESLKKAGKFVANLSKDMLGVYVVHMMILDYLSSKGVLEVLASPAWAFVVCAVVFLISTLISALLRRIPFVGRYLC